MGYDAICIVVSPEVHDEGVTSLSKEEVKQIYTGSITNWKDAGRAGYGDPRHRQEGRLRHQRYLP